MKKKAPNVAYAGRVTLTANDPRPGGMSVSKTWNSCTDDQVDWFMCEMRRLGERVAARFDEPRECR